MSRRAERRAKRERIKAAIVREFTARSKYRRLLGPRKWLTWTIEERQFDVRTYKNEGKGRRHRCDCDWCLSNKFHSFRKTVLSMTE